MHGITLTVRPADWEILQQEDHEAVTCLAGSFCVHPAAIEVGVESVCPVYRLVREADNSVLIPWTPMSFQVDEDFTGTFEEKIRIPEGGLYRIDTSLETKSTKEGITWLYRGDCVLHLGVGNLFLIAGQSNSAGYGRDYAMDPPHLCVHLFRNRSRWDLACHPMNESTDAGSLPNEEMGIPGVSPYLSFAKNFYEFSHCPVGLIQVSMGGSPMSRWLPGTGDLYQNMLDKIHMTKGKYAGVFWYQGCSDGYPEAAEHYYQHFEEMVQALRRELGYCIPFFTFQLNRFLDCHEDRSWGLVREAQRQAAHKMDRVFILPTINNAMSDGIHNSAHANVMLGEKLAKQAANRLLAAFPVFEAPDFESAALIDGRLCISFSHVSHAFTLPSYDPDQTGFFLEDENGSIPFTRITCCRQDRNRVWLTLSRPVGKEPKLSFAWEADPVRFPLTDETTFLPPLSFYQIPILRDESSREQETKDCCFFSGKLPLNCPQVQR